MAGEKPDVLLVGNKKPVMVKGLEGKVTLHYLIDAAGQGRLPQIDRRQGARHRRRLYRRASIDAGIHAALSQARADLQLRRRLRPCRRQMGGRARHHRHQYAGGAERGSGRHRARPLALHGARIPAGRALCARRQMDGGAISADQGDAAQPHRRHGRHGPHRQGDRAPAGGVRRAGGLSQPQSASRRRLQVLSQAHRHGARRRYADGDRAGRGGDGEHDQRRGAQGARSQRHPHQHGARLGGGRAGIDRGAEKPHHLFRRPRRVRQGTATCRRNLWRWTMSACSRISVPRPR